MFFNKNIFISNINMFLEKTGKKASELEVKAGVSRGYLSRLSLENNTSIPGIDFILAASEMFGVSVEAISTIDFSCIIETDNYYVDLLSKLINNTEKRDIVWKKLSLGDLKDRINNKESKKTPALTNTWSSIASAVNRMNFDDYKSEFEYEKNYNIKNDGDLFLLKLDEHNDMYITKVVLSYTEDENFCEFYGIELFIIRDNSDAICLCNVDPDRKHDYDTFLFKLYKTVVEAVKNKMLDNKTKDLLENFLNEQ